jgi:hypothetical protein
LTEFYCLWYYGIFPNSWKSLIFGASTNGKSGDFGDSLAPRKNNTLRLVC